LATTTLIVELHDFLIRHARAVIEQRFSGTHQIEIVTSELRDGDDISLLAHLGAADRCLAVDEQRPLEPYPMQWAVLVPEPGRFR
jgi:hypothetical protein